MWKSLSVIRRAELSVSTANGGSQWLTPVSFDYPGADEADGVAARLRVPLNRLPAFIACLAMGTLHAIHAGVLPAEAGIWSLGIPDFWERLEERGLAPQPLIDVLRVSDELAAGQANWPAGFEIEVGQRIEQLEAVLADLDPVIWHAYWDDLGHSS